MRAGSSRRVFRLPFPQSSALCWDFFSLPHFCGRGSGGVGRLRWVLWCAAALHGLTALLGRSAATSLMTTGSEYAGLLASAVLTVAWMRWGNRFYRLFAPLLLAVLGLAASMLWPIPCGDAT